MRSDQREIGCIVIKGHIRVPGRMAGKTGRILINITVHATVPIVGFGILVTNSTGKLRKIGGICVAFSTLHPLPLVLSAVNGEKLGIVLRVLCRHPI